MGLGRFVAELLLLPGVFRRCGGLGLQFPAGPADRLQPILPAPEFLRQVAHAVALAVAIVLLGVEDLRLAQQRSDLLLQLLLRFEHPCVAHGFVLAGIGLHLRAIQCHMAKAHHAGLLAEPQDLNKQCLKTTEVLAAEVTDPAVIRLLVAGDHPKGGILVAGPLDFSGGRDAHAVGIEQQHGEHPRVESLLPSSILLTGGRQDR